MIIKSKKIKDVVFFKNTSFKDNRGYFKELLKEKDFKKKFPFLVMSFSKKNVIRGLHLQTKNSQGKFISVIKGKIFDVVVDLRKNKNFRKKKKFILDSPNKSLIVPEGYAHGFQTLTDDCIVIYLHTNYYKKSFEITINPLKLGINWPIKKIIISKKDKNGEIIKK